MRCQKSVSSKQTAVGRKTLIALRKKRAERSLIRSARSVLPPTLEEEDHLKVSHIANPRLMAIGPFTLLRRTRAPPDPIWPFRLCPTYWPSSTVNPDRKSVV